MRKINDVLCDIPEAAWMGGANAAVRWALKADRAAHEEKAGALRVELREIAGVVSKALGQDHEARPAWPDWATACAGTERLRELGKEPGQ